MPKLSKKSASLDYDILIVGAGPAGLSFANLFAGSGKRIALIEKQSKAQLADPADDGREIALTHHSKKIMEEAGMWAQLPANAIAAIRHAKVSNTDLRYALHFDHHESGQEQLGFMVANHAIRKAAYQAAQGYDNLTWFVGCDVVDAGSDAAQSWVTLQDGRRLQGKLLIAADSRFSATRNMLGIPAQQKDFQRSCIVTRLAHTKDHAETAHECFLRDHTLAVLPLQGNNASIVITVDSDVSQHWLTMPDKDFAATIQHDLGDRLGTMRCTGKRFHYPLVAVYAARFYAQRCALLGDAAVGMHPVTAHGFNFGLRGAATLAQHLGAAQRLGLDLGDAAALHAYDRDHRRATWPLYQATNLLVKLYTDNRAPMQLARHALLRLGNHLAPARRAIIGQLTEAAA